MASICPKCHEDLEEDTICCAELKHAWKCSGCGKRTTGFVVPYGRCFLCGGEIEVVRPFEAVDPRAAAVVEEALQFELNTYHFYRIGKGKTSDFMQRSLFGQLELMEREHIEEIEEKYHVHLDENALTPPPDAREILEHWLFKDLSPGATLACARDLYSMAIQMERRTQEHFARRAVDLPAGPEREICRELAAEEMEHIAILETELAHLAQPPFTTSDT